VCRRSASPGASRGDPGGRRGWPSRGPPHWAGSQSDRRRASARPRPRSGDTCGGSARGRSGRRRRRTRAGSSANPQVDRSAARGPHRRRPGREVLDQDPLAMPGRGAPRLLEQLRVRDAVLAQPVDDAVVRANESGMEPRDEEVDVVTRIADQGDPLGVARMVVPAAEKQLGRVVAAVQVRARPRGRPRRAARGSRAERGSSVNRPDRPSSPEASDQR
jgi:hypothetical protein